MSPEFVQKIDENFINHGTREEFRKTILRFLNLFHDLSVENLDLNRRIGELEDELRVMKGEKKSPASRRRKK